MRGPRSAGRYVKVRALLRANCWLPQSMKVPFQLLVVSCLKTSQFPAKGSTLSRQHLPLETFVPKTVKSAVGRVPYSLWGEDIGLLGGLWWLRVSDASLSRDGKWLDWDPTMCVVCTAGGVLCRERERKRERVSNESLLSQLILSLSWESVYCFASIEWSWSRFLGNCLHTVIRLKNLSEGRTERGPLNYRARTAVHFQFYLSFLLS